jgi:KDO2-lipid IV(A) lauroyltransferase
VTALYGPDVRALRAAIGTSAAIVARLPAGVAAALGAAGGTIEWAVRQRKRARLAANLAHALDGDPASPATRRLVRRNMRAAGRRAADLLWAVARPAEAAAGVRVANAARLEAALAAGRGAILAGPHCGGFEVAHVVAPAFPAIRLLALIDRTRIAAALELLRRSHRIATADAAATPHAALRHLRDGGALVAIADLWRPGMRGHAVRLLDARVLLPAGTAVLSRLSGAPVLPFAALPIGPRAWCIEIGEPIAAPVRSTGHDGEIATTQALADAFGTILRAHPEQWDAVDPIAWLAEDA